MIFKHAGSHDSRLVGIPDLSRFKLSRAGSHVTPAYVTMVQFTSLAYYNLTRTGCFIDHESLA